MKKRLRESLVMPETKPIHHESQKTVQLLPEQNQEILKISPTTKLPTKFDRIQILNPIPPKEKIHINLTVTNGNNKSQIERATVDYSTKKYIPVPDARSITQWVQYTRGDYGLGVYVDDGSADWLYKLRKKTTPPYSGFDADPVRAIQQHKARKRQKKVNQILKAYGQD